MAVGGGLKAIRSVFHYSKQIGPLKLWQALRSKNACKACAFGTGGQKGGIHNESGHGIEFCNKNVQAHLSDTRPLISAPYFFERSIAQLRSLSGKELEDLGRLGSPLYKAPQASHYTPITYDEAIARTVQRFSACAADASFFYASGRSSNEAAYLLQLLARLYGTNNINNCSYYCHQASGVALSETIGTGTATVEYADLDLADLIFVFGANPASNHPRFVKTLLKARRRGARVVVVNPAKEPGMVRFASPSDWRSMIRGGEAVASHYVQPHVGGDIAFIQGLVKRTLELGRRDREFISQYTLGFEEYQAQIEGLRWQDIEARSGVDQATIREIAELYCNSDKTILCWSMGLTHHLHGVHNIQSLVSLCLLRGMLGRPGAGLLPLRGHSNIQGTGSMGFTPQLKQAIETSLVRELGRELPEQAGMDTMACMQASHAGDIQCAFMLGGNLLASNPDKHFATSALNNIPFKVFLNPTLNMSHVEGVDGEVIILPVKARDEEQQPTTQESMFNFVRLSDGGIYRHPHLLSEIDIIVQFGQRLISKDTFDFSQMANHQTIRQWIAKTIPGFTALGEIDQSKQEFHIEGRILHKPIFNTPTQKAHFMFHPAPQRDEKEFLLTSVRSEGQFNSIIYHEFDAYREQQGRQVVMMNPQDMQALNLKENQLVNLKNATGSLSKLKVRPFDIRRGNIMTYYPEANALVPKEVDQSSRTPAFKSVAVKIEQA